MKDFKLEDIRPQKAELKLSSTGKTYTLRPMSLGDELWIHQTFNTNLGELVRKTKMAELSRLAYRLIEDKTDFLKQERKYVDEEGNSVTMNVGGVEAFLSMVLGQNEQVELFKAIIKAYGISQPMLDNIDKEIEKKSQEVLNPLP